MVRSLALVLAFASGCDSVDYGVSPDTEGHGPTPFPAEIINIDFNISVDVAFQRHNFGDDVARCQFQVALLWTWESDGFGEPREGGDERNPEDEPPESDDKIEQPREPGECALSTFDEEGGQPIGGRWQVRGTIDAGDEIYLLGKNGDITLTRHTDGEGRVYYDLPDCDADTFPFSDTFDLDAPNALMGEGMDPLFLEELIGVGPSLAITSPTPEELVEGRLELEQGEELELLMLG